MCYPSSRLLGSLVLFTGFASVEMNAQSPPPDQIKGDLKVLLAPSFDIRKVETPEYQALKSRIVRHAASYNSAILGVYLGPKFHPDAMVQVPIADLMKFMSLHDRAGTRTVTRSLKTSINNCLTVYDLVKEKQALFQLVSEKDGETIRKLVQLRDQVTEILNTLDQSAPSSSPQK
jgi:hypothetical protein